MDFIQCLQNRRSIRKFKKGPVIKQDIEKIIDAARLAPTARNVQPWEFIVIRNEKKIKELACLVTPNGDFLSEVNTCLVIVCKDTKYYLEDGSAATTLALFAATSLGLGGCWIAGDKKDYADKVMDFLCVGAGYKLISILAIGYPDETPKPVKRPLESMIHWEKF